MIDFSSFLINFRVNVSDFSEKVRFPIKNRVFWPFFCLNFSQFLVIFNPFLGSFLGFLGGYPSPSISAPLVVKKCPKLYIYNIGVGWYHQPWPHILCHDATWPMAKCVNPIGAKNTDERTRITEKSYPVNLPDMLNLKQKINQKQYSGSERGEREFKTSKLPCESPRHFN